MAERSSLVAGFLIATKTITNNAASSSRSIMVRKLIIIVVDAVLSVAVINVVTILLASAGSAIFGNVKGTDGVNYGNYNSTILIAIAFAITVAFSIWFYKFTTKIMNKRKVEK